MENSKLTLLNFRELGGIPTTDGKIIKSGKLFRSAAIQPKTEDDYTFLNGLNLDYVIDFRSEAEAAEKKDYIPKGAEYISAPVFNLPEHEALAPTKGMVLKVLKADKAAVKEMEEGITDTYRFMPSAKHAYNYVFDAMDKGKNIDFHCTAGKDRTGVCALLIELALGVSTENCKADYLLSNEYHKKNIAALKRKLKLAFVKPHIVDFFIKASETYVENLDVALGEILKYGTVENFFAEVYGIDEARIENWKRLYLCSAAEN